MKTYYLPLVMAFIATSEVQVWIALAGVDVNGKTMIGTRQ